MPDLNFSDYFGQSYSAQSPARLAQAGSLQEFQKRASDIANIRSVSPEQLRMAMQGGQGVTASLGFNDPGELLGMSPVEYQTMLAPKETPTQILMRNLQLADQVTGAPELRKNLQAGSEAALRGDQTLIGNASEFAGRSVRGDIDNNARSAESTKNDTANAAAAKLIADARLAQDKIENAFKNRQIKMQEQTNVFLRGQAAKEAAGQKGYKDNKLGMDYDKLFMDTLDPKGAVLPGREDISTNAYILGALHKGNVTHGTPVKLKVPYTANFSDGKKAKFDEFTFSNGTAAEAPVPGFYGTIPGPGGTKIPRLLFSLDGAVSGGKKSAGGVATEAYKKFGDIKTGMAGVQ